MIWILRLCFGEFCALSWDFHHRGWGNLIFVKFLYGIGFFWWFSLDIGPLWQKEHVLRVDFMMFIACSLPSAGDCSNIILEVPRSNHKKQGKFKDNINKQQFWWLISWLTNREMPRNSLLMCFSWETCFKPLPSFLKPLLQYF